MRVAARVAEPRRAEEVVAGGRRPPRRPAARGGPTCVRLVAAPCRTDVEQLGTCHDQQQQRRVARPSRPRAREVDERRLGPLEVVDDEHERPRRASVSSTLRTAQHASSGATGSPAGFEQLARDARSPAPRRRPPASSRPGRAERLDERPPGQPVAVGQASPGGDRRALAERLGHLGDEARLAHARRAQDGEQLAGAVRDGLVEGVEQPLALARAPDHRRARPLRPPRRPARRPPGGRPRAARACP